jgi:riboflavin kinase/FMN adenylyltransferase
MLLGGTVVEGDHRGRELGYPTANVAAANWYRMPEGVFAGTVRLADGSLYRSAVSVGRRETFYAPGAPLLVEAFLLDFDGNLYGQNLRVELLSLIRPQRRFGSVHELIKQIEGDVAFVRSEVKLIVPHPPRPIDRGGHDSSSSCDGGLSRRAM